MDFRGTREQQRSLSIATRNSFVPLCAEGAVINPLGAACSRERTVGMLLPGLTPGVKLIPGIPFAGLHRMQAALGGLAQCQHDMRMKVSRVVALLGNGAVQREVRHHALANKLLPYKVLHQHPPLIGAELVGQGHVELPRQLRVAPALHLLNGVPEFFAVSQPPCPAFGHDDFPVLDPSAMAVIPGLPLTLVVQPFTRPVGCCCNGIVRSLLRAAVQVLSSLAAPHDLGAEMINRHAVAPSPT